MRRMRRWSWAVGCVGLGGKTAGVQSDGVERVLRGAAQRGFEEGEAGVLSRAL